MKEEEEEEEEDGKGEGREEDAAPGCTSFSRRRFVSLNAFKRPLLIALLPEHELAS